MAGDAQVQSDVLPAREQAALYPQETRYTITRKGKRIGTHVMTFSSNAERLRVSVESNIKVTVLKVPVYRFNDVSTEQWRDKKLVNVTARTDQGGNVTRVELTEKQVQTTKFSSNHWNPAGLNANEICNTRPGKVNQVTIETVGTDTLSAGHDLISAAHYRYSGDPQTEVWYDEQNRCVQMQIKGDDGSTIKYTADPLRMNP